MSWRESIKKIISEISGRRDFVRGEKGELEDTYQKLKQWRPKEASGEIARISGLAGVDLSWFLFCLGKYTAKDLNAVFLDNKIIENFKQKNKNTKIKDTDAKYIQFFKNLQKSYPRTAARLKLWMIYTLFAGMSIGGVNIAQKNQNSKDVSVQNIDDYQDGNHIESVAQIDFMNNDIYVDDQYDLKSKNFKTKFIEDNWNDIVIGLLEFETYYKKPKLLSGESRYTYGPGLTWVYIDNVQQACNGKYEKIAENFSDEEIWNQVKQHCLYEKEALDRIQKSCLRNGIDKISKEQALGLFFAGYQIPGKLSKIISRLKSAGDNEQKIIDAFIAGKEIKKKWRNGTNKRRWWCAMLYTGKINVNDFLQMNRDAFSNVSIDSIKSGNHFLYDDSTVYYALSQTNENVSTVQEFIDSMNVLDNISEPIYFAKQNKTEYFNRGINKIKNMKKVDKSLFAQSLINDVKKI